MRRGKNLAGHRPIEWPVFNIDHDVNNQRLSRGWREHWAFTRELKLDPAIGHAGANFTLAISLEARAERCRTCLIRCERALAFEMIGQAEHEVFAEAELLNGTKFIRLVCLVYVSGPTNRAWYVAS
jgi:hypothetical protein